jgi:mRNA interferase RelE/StbE
MGRYTVKLSKSANRTLDAFDSALQRRVVQRLDELAENPRPSGSKKLAGADLWRTRVGDYRIVYEIEDEVLTVLVIRIGHRREVYR